MEQRRRIRRREAAATIGACAALAACAGGPTSTVPAPSAPVEAVSAPPPPAFLRADIEGREAGAVDDLLGAPALVRREGAGEFRRYDLDGCNVAVLLRRDGQETPVVSTIYASAKRSGEAAPDLDDCIARGLSPTDE